MEKRSRVDLIAALLAGLIGLLALGVSAYSVALQRQQVRAEVWPHLQLSFANDNGFRFIVDNSGVGPAEIRTVEVRWKTTAVSDWSRLFALIVPGTKTEHVNGYLHGRVVPPGASINAVQVPSPGVAARLEEALGDVSVEICYCSVLDECWRLRDDSEQVTERVSACPAVAVPFRI